MYCAIFGVYKPIIDDVSKTSNLLFHVARCEVSNTVGKAQDSYKLDIQCKSSLEEQLE